MPHISRVVPVVLALLMIAVTMHTPGDNDERRVALDDAGGGPEEAAGLSAYGPPADEGGENTPAGEEGGGEEEIHDTRANDRNVVYLIVAADSFADELQPLVDWKTRKGVPAELVTVSQIITTTGGVDKADQIRNYIAGVDADEPLRYVLLAGDSEDIPAREILTNGSDLAGDISRDFYPSDAYYAGLDGDWDTDGDGVYGEPYEEDWYADAYVGRIPADTDAQMKKNVERIIGYQTSPEPGDWTGRALFASGLLDSPNQLDDEGTAGTDEGYGHWEDNGKEMTDMVLPSFPEGMGQTFLYDYNTTVGGSWSLSGDTLNQNSFNDEFESGYSMVTIGSHGYHSRNGTAHYTGPTGTERTDCWENFFHYSDTGSVQNGDMLPFVYISACFVLDFTEEDDSNFERLFTNPDGGAIGVVGPTDYTYRGETYPTGSYGNWRLADYYFRHLLGTAGADHHHRTIGGALYEAKEDYMGYLLTRPPFTRESEALRMNMASYNLLGDPEITPWNRTPMVMNVTADPVYLDSGIIRVKVTDNATGEPMVGAKVVVLHDDIYEEDYTDENGRATFTPSFTSTGTLSVTALEDQYLPGLLDVEVTARPADLVTEASLIGFSDAGPIDGETVTITAGVYNRGGLDASGVEVDFYWGGPEDGDRIGDRQVIPKVLAGTGAFTAASASVDAVARGGDWTVTVVVDPDNGIAELDEDNNTANTTLQAAAADLELSLGDVGDYSFTTTDPVVLPRGQNGTLSVEVLNAGVLAASANATVEAALAAGGSGTGGVLARGEAGPLGPGAAAAVPLGFVPSGDFMTVRFTADPDNDIHEEDENDNELKVTFTIGDAPALAVPDLAMDEDASLGPIDILEHVTDADTPQGQLTVELLDFTCRTLDAGAVLTAGRYLTVDSQNDTYGEVQILLRASDGVLFADQNVILTVEPVNDAPRFDEGEFITDIYIDQGGELNVTVPAWDPEGGNITYTDDSGVFDIDRVNGTLIAATDDSHVGTHVVNVTVTDEDGASAAVTLTIVIADVNDLPVLVNLDELDGSTADPGSRFLFQVMAEDVEGDALEFSDNTSLFEIERDTGVISFIPDKSDAGVHHITITVNDGRDVVSGTVVITVTGEGGSGGGEGDDEQGAGPAFIAGSLIIVILLIAGLLLILARAGKLPGKRKDAGTEEGEDETEDGGARKDGGPPKGGPPATVVKREKREKRDAKMKDEDKGKGPEMGKGADGSDELREQKKGELPRVVKRRRLTSGGPGETVGRLPGKAPGGPGGEKGKDVGPGADTNE